jgi:hypothetical protein
MRTTIMIVFLFLAGCASRAGRENAAERHGYERGYRQAVKEQYWILQAGQRLPAPTEPSQP